MGLENYWDASDFQNARESWLAQQQWVNRRVIFRKFAGFERQGSGIEEVRQAKYDERAETVYLSEISSFDTVKGGYFTTGELDVNTAFRIRGQSPSYRLKNGQVVEEYVGDQIIWNGKVWIVSDQVEPVIFGTLGRAIYWRSVMRRVDRAGQGVETGALG